MYENGEEGGEMDGAGGYCLTGIGIDRPRDAMERVAEGCWSMLRDVKSTPPTLTLSGYFFLDSLNATSVAYCATRQPSHWEVV